MSLFLPSLHWFQILLYFSFQVSLIAIVIPIIFYSHQHCDELMSYIIIIIQIIIIHINFKTIIFHPNNTSKSTKTIHPTLPSSLVLQSSTALPFKELRCSPSWEGCIYNNIISLSLMHNPKEPVLFHPVHLINNTDTNLLLPYLFKILFRKAPVC